MGSGGRLDKICDLTVYGCGSLLVVAAIMLFFSVPASAKTFMSCGWAPQYFDGEQISKGSLKFVSRPRNCDYSSDGTEAGHVRLENLLWRGWGKRKTTATGWIRDNHDQDNNGFQRYRVRVTLSQRGDYRPSGWFYLRMRLSTGGSLSLQVPDFHD